MESVDKITEVSKLSPSRRVAWYTTFIIVVLATALYFDRKEVIDVLKQQIVRLTNESASKDRIIEKVTAEKEAAQEKYNKLMEKTFRYNDSIAKDNRNFINEIKGIK